MEDKYDDYEQMLSQLDDEQKECFKLYLMNDITEKSCVKLDLEKKNGPSIYDISKKFKKLNHIRNPFRAYEATIQAMDEMGFNDNRRFIRSAFCEATFGKDKTRIISYMRNWFGKNNSVCIDILVNTFHDERFWQDLFKLCKEECDDLIYVLKKMNDPKVKAALEEYDRRMKINCFSKV